MNKIWLVIEKTLLGGTSYQAVIEMRVQDVGLYTYLHQNEILSFGAG